MTDSHRDRLMFGALAGVLQTIASGLALVLLYRFLLEHLGAEIFGEWSLILSILGLTHVVNLGLAGSGLKLTAGSLAKQDFSDARWYTRWSILGTTLITIPGIVVTVIIAPSLIAFIGGASHFSDSRVLFVIGMAVWLGAMLQSLRSSIDAMQRVDLRHLTVGVQALLFLLLSWVLVPCFGFHGLVASFLFASAIATVMSATTLYQLWRAMPQGGSASPLKLQFGNMIRYGLPFNLTSMASLLCDPLTKYLLGSLGSFSAVAWYEMASRLIFLLRGLTVSAMEGLTPYVAAMTANNPENINAKYSQSLRISVFVAGPFFMAIFAAAPFISFVWIGECGTYFIAFLQLLSIAWFINVISAPAYFFALGIGYQKWNLMAHVLMAVLNLILSISLGGIWGGLGVVLGFSLAVIAGSVLQITGYHRDSRLLFNAVTSFRPVAIVFSISAVASIAVGALWWIVPDSVRFLIFFVGLGIGMLALLTPFFEPVVTDFARSFLRRPSGENT